jgi:S1-C subfamily serine protease
MATPVKGGSYMDINTILMRSTFKIAGKGSVGTAFIIWRPVPKDTEKLFYVLVTADHVLRDIEGEQATLYLRKKQRDEFVKLPFTLQIRRGNEPLWKKHPETDVAVMYVRLPKEADIQVLPMSLLATDDMLNQFEIHPGDTLSCLGYPYGAEANEAGFPILRSGQIASYPLTPTEQIQTFLFDFRVFSGNSGGPVYFVQSNRSYGGSTRLGQTIQFFAGLVSQEKFLEEEVRSLTETRRTKHRLSIAVVVHAALILETIDLLPDHPEE